MSNVRDAYKDIPTDVTAGNWWHNAGLVKLYFFVSVVFVGQALNGIDDGLLGSFQALDSWRAALDYPDNDEIGLLTASAYIAGLITAPIAGYVADRWGRRWCVRWSALTMLLGATLGTLSGVGGSGYGLFLASRVVIGSGIAFCLMISPVMLQEYAHPKHRTVVAALFDQNYCLGGFIIAWIIFGTSYIENSNWSWRIPYLVQLIPAVYLVIAIQFIPETPRWLMAKGREAEAMDFLVKYHGNGNPNDELVNFEFLELKESLEAEKRTKQDTWKEFVSTKGNRHRIAIVLLIVSCQNLSGTAIIQQYYTRILNLVGVSNTQQQTGINAGLTMFVWAVTILAAWVADRVKRRKLLLTTWSCLIVINVAFVVTAQQYEKTGSRAAGIANVVMLWLYDGCFFMVCGPLFFSYHVECLSYSTRAKGMIVWGVVNKIISIFNAYVNSIALDRIGWKYYLVYTCLLVVQLIFMYFLCVETSGYTLEEIAVLFDGDDKIAHVEVAAFEEGAHADKTAGVKSDIKEVKGSDSGSLEA